MKRLRFVLGILAVVSLALPPTASAEVVCNVYTFRYVGYFPDCACNACAGWSPWNCTECVNTESGGACWSNGTGPCAPGGRHQDI
jgi:hypothetical protein